MTTIKENLRCPHEVIDRQLARALRNRLAAAYDRSQFLEQRQDMAQRWADYIDAARRKKRFLALADPAATTMTRKEPFMRKLPFTLAIGWVTRDDIAMIRDVSVVASGKSTP